MKTCFVVLCCLFGIPALALSQTAALMTLAQHGTADEVRAHLAAHTYSPKELTLALYDALEKNPSAAVVEALLKAGADAQDSVGAYASTLSEDASAGEMYGAVPWSDDVAKAEVLLRYGADPNREGFEGVIYIMDCSLEMLKLLLRYKADPNLPIGYPACPRNWSSGEEDANEVFPCTALEFAIKDPFNTGSRKVPDLERIRILLDAGARSNYYIYRLAVNAKLPRELLQRLDPRRAPDGSLKTVKGLLSTALALLQKKDFRACDETLEDLRRSFELSKPVLAAVYYLKSLCWEDNIEDAKRAVLLDPAEPRNQRQYIAALLAHHEYTQALDAVKNAFARTPGDSQLYLYRAAARMHTGNLQQAAHDIDASLAVKELPQAYFLRGELHILRREEEAAEQDFKRALEKGHNSKIRENELYQILLRERAGDREEALRLEKAFQTDWYSQFLATEILLPGGLINPLAQKFLAMSSDIHKERAKQWAKTIYGDGSSSDPRQYRIEELTRERDRYTAPQEKAALSYLLSFCLETVEAQIKALDDAIRLAPQEYVFPYRRGELLLMRKNLAGALKDFLRAMSCGQTVLAHQNLLYQAFILSRQGDSQGALRAAKQAGTYARSAADTQQVAQCVAALEAGDASLVQQSVFRTPAVSPSGGAAQVRDPADAGSNVSRTPGVSAQAPGNMPRSSLPPAASPAGTDNNAQGQAAVVTPAPSTGTVELLPVEQQADPRQHTRTDNSAAGSVELLELE